MPTSLLLSYFNSVEADLRDSTNPFTSFCVTKILTAWLTFVKKPSGAAEPLAKLGANFASLKSWMVSFPYWSLLDTLKGSTPLLCTLYLKKIFLKSI
jgi:hypothetical protein